MILSDWTFTWQKEASKRAPGLHGNFHGDDNREAVTIDIQSNPVVSAEKPNTWTAISDATVPNVQM